MSIQIKNIFQLPVYIHLIVVMIISVLAGFGAIKYIDLYTNHNQTVSVPDVKGLQIEDAAPFLENNSLRYTIVDSIYSKEVPPGAITELSPEANSRVKKNRIISITVNAKTEETAPVPELTGISRRQAYAEVKARGFKYIEEKWIEGEYRDLTVGIEYNGNIMQSGDRVPLSAILTLVYEDGNISQLEDEDEDENNTIIIKSDESWLE